MVCVLPGCEDVLARALRFSNALISEDFPTFDLPAKATSSSKLSGIVLVIPHTVSKFTSLITTFVSSFIFCGTHFQNLPRRLILCGAIYFRPDLPRSALGVYAFFKTNQKSSFEIICIFLNGGFRQNRRI